MRMQSQRTREMITAPEVPRTAWGGIALCHFCQRWAYFKGGFLLLLADDLQRMARFPALRSKKPV